MKGKKAKQTKKWTVYMLTPYAEWNGVEGGNEKEAISKCDAPEYDYNEPAHFIALEEKEEGKGGE